MKIDRRITNGLAWAGAVLVVAIPAADFALRQMSPAPTEQLALISEEPAEEVSLPTPTAERPAVAEASAVDPDAAEAYPVTTAAAQPRSSSNGTAVDNFVQSGRPMPSYISGGEGSAVFAPSTPATQSAAAPTPSARPQTTTPTTSTPARTPQSAMASPTPATANTPAAQPQTPAASTQTAALPPRPEVTMPTPVSQRPASVPQSQVSDAQPGLISRQPAQTPLIIEDNSDVYTADDLADWESGPLSDFLANRNGRTQSAPAPEPAYDSNGFFLDQGPNNNRQQPFPRAYGEGFYYPFSD